MVFTEANHRKLIPALLLLVAAWVVELCGLAFLFRSCQKHECDVTIPADWASGAQLPTTTDCIKLFRFHWWSLWLDLIILVGLLIGLAARGTRWSITRWRYPLAALLAVSAFLHMWSANTALNLTDLHPTRFMTRKELSRARVTFLGACALAAADIILLFLLGDDGLDAEEEPEAAYVGSAFAGEAGRDGGGGQRRAGGVERRGEGPMQIPVE